MPTYEQFLSMDLVEECSGKNKSADVCDTCWIHNCKKSYLYKASMFFWYEYNENARRNVLTLRMLGNIAPRKSVKDKFRIVPRT